jgi:predicted Zn-dependent protease
LVLSAFFGDVSGLSSGILSQVNRFKSLDYSRELETEADNNGLQIMLKNKVDPKGMLVLLKLLKEVNLEEPGLMKYLSTHPDTDSRINNISANPFAKKTFDPNKQLKVIFENIKRTL